MLGGMFSTSAMADELLKVSLDARANQQILFTRRALEVQPYGIEKDAGILDRMNVMKDRVARALPSRDQVDQSLTSLLKRGAEGVSKLKELDKKHGISKELFDTVKGVGEAL